MSLIIPQNRMKKKSEIPKNKKELFEKLSDIEHQRWADWQKHLHSKCTKDEEGNLVIPAEYVKSLEQQIVTPYIKLSESDKEKDREQVMRYWHLITEEEK